MATRRYGSIAKLNQALRAWPKDMNAELRDAAADVAERVATRARSSAGGGVAGLAATTLRVRRDRVPALTMGGAKKLPNRSKRSRRKTRRGPGQTYGRIVWGAEFGGQGRATTMQFKPHRGQEGYFLWPTVRAEEERSKAAYVEAMMDTLRSKR